MPAGRALPGRPLHQLLAPLPVGLLASAPLFDVAWALTGRSGLGDVGYWNLLGGVALAITLGLGGIWDLVAVPRARPALLLGLLRGVAGLLALTLFGAALLLRHGERDHPPLPAAFGLELAAVALGLLTAWLTGTRASSFGTTATWASRLGPEEARKWPSSDGARGLQSRGPCAASSSPSPSSPPVTEER